MGALSPVPSPVPVSGRGHFGGFCPPVVPGTGCGQFQRFVFVESTLNYFIGFTQKKEQSLKTAIAL